MGLLPTPKQVYGRTTNQFKDINIVTIDSSSDVETHMLEEIRQLKEHSRKQDRVIEELKNNQMNNENQEPAMGNSAGRDHGNSQKQAVQVHSKRKRVECVAPNQEDRLLEHRNELNKEICEYEYSAAAAADDDLLLPNEKCQDETNDKELSIEEAEEMSPQCSNNGSRQIELDSLPVRFNTGRITKKQKEHHGVLRDTPTTRREVAHDKVDNRNRKNHKQAPPVKVGSTVTLLTAKYPNKVVVAYATILSTNPKDCVGGVEIGNQFYKVRVNHPTANEPLVRPMSGYNNIGDAHAKGVPIAWPSTLVEMING